jgi:hypothetical protein
LSTDNLSHISADTSDTLCTVSTGGALGTRELYSNSEESAFKAKRPWLLNGISDVVTRPDLISRGCLAKCPELGEEDIRTEEDLEAEFNDKHPRILGVMLDAISTGLRNFSTTKLPKLPRMADFARWVSACETEFWPAGTFLNALNKNLIEAVYIAIDADNVAKAVCVFGDELRKAKLQWVGTARTLLDVLADKTNDRTSVSKYWPKDASALSRRLEKLSKTLRKVGIKITFSRTSTERAITITAELNYTPPNAAEAESTEAAIKAWGASGGVAAP